MSLLKHATRIEKDLGRSKQIDDNTESILTIITNVDKLKLRLKDLYLIIFF